MLPNHLGPLHMSPVDRADRDEKRLKILGTSFGAKLEKQNKTGETQPSYYFCAYHGFGNPFSCITAVKRVANDVMNHILLLVSGTRRST